MMADMLKKRYKTLRPLIVWLGIAELVWISIWLARATDGHPLYTATVVAWIVVTLGWLGFVIFSGRRDFFLKYSRWFSNLVGVGIVVAIAAILFSAVPTAWDGLVSAAFVATHSELAAIHMLRLLAIGTFIKYIQRQLPLHFVILGSVPDFLFAVSAIAVTWMAASGLLTVNMLTLWHTIGALVFLGAGFSMFFSVPSPIRLYHEYPDASIVFKFPMLMAPNFTVPLFILAHAFAQVKLAMPLTQ